MSFLKINKPVYAFQTPMRLGLVILFLAGLLGGAHFTASAASQPVMTVIGVTADLRVTVRIDNLPPNTEYSVTEGPGGSRGAGGGVIAHISSGEGGSRVYTFEIFVDLQGTTSADIRIDNGAGSAAYATFDPSVSVDVDTTTPTSTTSSAAASAAAPAAPASTSQPVGNIRVLHVERGGIVIVMISDLPKDVIYSVVIGPGGSQGYGGYLVAHVGGGYSDTVSATFEIPTPLSSTATLDLRLDASGSYYLKSFSNADY